MRLYEWIKIFPVTEVIGETDLMIRTIVSDSRKVQPGDLFVALPGSKQDGRQFIGEAINRGATAVVMEGPIPDAVKQSGRPITGISVMDARKAASHLASYFYGNPAEALCLIGVTGTNGKTTTTYLVRSILHAAGIKGGLIGTVEYDCIDDRRVATHTTPGVLELQQLFSRMKTSGATHVVMEVSSHALDQDRVAGCRFHLAVFTNLTQDHLDYHGNMDAYFAAKQKLFNQVDTAAGWTVVNMDDPWGRRLKGNLRCIGFGIEEESDCYPMEISSDLHGIRMRLATPLGELRLASPLLGKYNVYNILAATSVGVALGLSKEVIATGIAAMEGVPGRFEKINEGQDFCVIVDYAHTEDALSRLLIAVSDSTPRNIITVFGCGGDRDHGKRPRMGKVATQWSDYTIITSDNPRNESPLSIISEIEEGIKGRTSHYEVIPDRKKAIYRAIGLAQEGDTVVIAGKGHEDYQIVGYCRFPFDDREVARLALRERLNSQR